MKGSEIVWTDNTWNPWEGCSKVSPGCENCYAKTMCDDRWGRVEWGEGGTRRRVVSTLKAPHKWHKEVISTGRKARVFCASLADVFDDHPSIRQEWRDHLWNTIAETPFLDYLVLSKRPENFERFLPEDWGDGYSNVTLMVTVENQEYAGKRIPMLLETPARSRALSVEPMIGPVDLSPWLSKLDWVIAGGESGHGSRPMNPNWVREIRDGCEQEGVPFLFKQWGFWIPEELSRAKTHTFDDGQIVYYRARKHDNGNHLDGRQHLDHPHREKINWQESTVIARS